MNFDLIKSCYESRMTNFNIAIHVYNLWSKAIANSTDQYYITICIQNLAEYQKIIIMRWIDLIEYSAKISTTNKNFSEKNLVLDKLKKLICNYKISQGQLNASELSWNKIYDEHIKYLQNQTEFKPRRSKRLSIKN